MEYAVKRISQELIHDFKYVYENTNNTVFDESWFVKKFDTSQYGLQNIGFIAYSSEGEPAAFYGVFPIQINQNGKPITIAQSGETMTHTSHRNKGLFKMLFLKTMDLAKESGIKFFFGFPNQNSLPGFIKFGWINSHETNRYLIPVKIPLLLKVKQKLDLTNFTKKRQQKIDRIKINYTQLSGAKLNQPHSRMQIERNAGYFLYKSFSTNFFIKVNDAYVWAKIEGNTFFIGDIFFPENGNYQFLTNEIINYIGKLGFSTVLFLCDPKHPLNSNLSCFAKPTKTLPLIIYHVDPGFSGTDMDMQYSSADFDTF